MDKTEKGENVEDAEVLDTVKPCREHLESEQLTEEDILELMIGDEREESSQPVETSVTL